MEPHADRQKSPGTQGTPYTAAEKMLIEELALHRVTKEQIRALFPLRTVNAVKKRIVEARHRMGLIEPQQGGEGSPDPATLPPDDPGFDDGWYESHCAAQAKANLPFLEALRAA